jgi:hypothetical protein
MDFIIIIEIFHIAINFINGGKPIEDFLIVEIIKKLMRKED